MSSRNGKLEKSSQDYRAIRFSKVNKAQRTFLTLRTHQSITKIDQKQSAASVNRHLHSSPSVIRTLKADPSLLRHLQARNHYSDYDLTFNSLKGLIHHSLLLFSQTTHRFCVWRLPRRNFDHHLQTCLKVLQSSVAVGLELEKIASYLTQAFLLVDLFLPGHGCHVLNHGADRMQGLFCFLSVVTQLIGGPQELLLYLRELRLKRVFD